jgi:alpha-tubulin suppressor-like RCC1 family protein
VYSWGKGDKGQLGIGRFRRSQVLPTKLDFFADYKRTIIVSEISAGKCHSCFVSTKGRFFACGSHYIINLSNLSLDIEKETAQ